MTLRIRRSGKFWAVEQRVLLIALVRSFREACEIAKHWTDEGLVLR